MTPEQSKQLGVPQAGPFKPETYRYSVSWLAPHEAALSNQQPAGASLALSCPRKRASRRAFGTVDWIPACERVRESPFCWRGVIGGIMDVD